MHSKGCVNKMETWIRDNLVPIAGVVLFVLLIQVVFLCLCPQFDRPFDHRPKAPLKYLTTSLKN